MCKYESLVPRLAPISSASQGTLSDYSIPFLPKVLLVSHGYARHSLSHATY